MSPYPNWPRILSWAYLGVSFPANIFLLQAEKHLRVVMTVSNDHTLTVVDTLVL